MSNDFWIVTVYFAVVIAVIVGGGWFLHWRMTIIVREALHAQPKSSRKETKTASTQQNIAGRIANALKGVINENVHIEVIVENRAGVGPAQVNQILVSLHDQRFKFEPLLILQVLVCPDLVITTKPNVGAILGEFSEGRLLNFLGDIKSFVRNYDKGIIPPTPRPIV